MIWIGTALALSLMGGLHCAGMCGGFAALALSKAKKWHFSRAFFLYTLGKTTTYAIVGGIAGGVGTVFHQSPLGSRILAGIIGIMMIWIGTELAGVNPIATRFNLKMPQWFRIAFSEAIQSHSKTSKYLMGLFNGFLPCGLLYAAFAAAASTSRPSSGALFMIVFGIGTLPSLFLAAHMFKAVSTSTRMNVTLATGWLIVLFGLVTLLRGVIMLPSMTH